jgi:hypothetical protein
VSEPRWTPVGTTVVIVGDKLRVETYDGCLFLEVAMFPRVFIVRAGDTIHHVERTLEAAHARAEKLHNWSIEVFDVRGDK